MHELDLACFRLTAYPRAGGVNWILWVNEDGESHGVDKLFAGRVKLQDDPVVTANTVLHDAIEKLESTLVLGHEDPLF